MKYLYIKNLFQKFIKSFQNMNINGYFSHNNITYCNNIWRGYEKLVKFSKKQNKMYYNA